MQNQTIRARQAGGEMGNDSRRDTESRASAWKTSMAVLLVVGMAAMQSGCATLLGAGAGAAAGVAGGIAYTNRGVSSQVKGDVSRVKLNAETVFRDMGIQKTGSESKEFGKVQRLSGVQGNTRVNVTIKSSGKNISSVEVQAQESPIQWNKELAKSIMDRLVQRG